MERLKKLTAVILSLVIFIYEPLSGGLIIAKEENRDLSYKYLSPSTSLNDADSLNVSNLLGCIITYIRNKLPNGAGVSDVSKLFGQDKGADRKSISFSLGKWRILFYDPTVGEIDSTRGEFEEKLTENLTFKSYRNGSEDSPDDKFLYYILHIVPLDYKVLEETISGLSKNAKEKLLLEIDGFAKDYGLHMLSSQERHVLYRLIESLGSESVNKLKSLDEDTKGEILNSEWGYTNIAISIMAQMVREETYSTIDTTPLKNGPAIVFVSPPQPEGCVIVPPIGINLVASFLQKLGVDVRLIDLSLDKDMKELKETIQGLGSRIRFISFGSSTYLRPYNFPYATRSIYKVKNLVNELGSTSPVLIAGGMGFSYLYRTYLLKTPIEIILRRFGSKCLAQMFFEVKPEKMKNLRDLYGGIKNLYIKDDKEIFETEIIKEDTLVLLVEGYSFNPANIRYSEYYENGYWPDICPTGPVGVEPDMINGTQMPPNGVFPFNVMDRIWAVLVSYIGSCTRKCKGCIYSQWSEKRISFSVMHLLDQLRNLYIQSPQIMGVGYIDDDFLVNPQLDRTLEMFGYFYITRLLSLYMETSPSSFTNREKLLLQLRDAGFRKISFGVENPITPKVLCDLNKIRDDDGDGVFELFQKIPKICTRLGIFTKATMILFWPTITQEELFRTMEEYLDFINNGINISVFPYLQIREGTPIGEEVPEGSVYQVYDIEGNRIEQWDKVLPKDPEVRRIAGDAMNNAGGYLKEIVEKYGLQEHYHPQLIVLALMKAILNEWKDREGIPQEIYNRLSSVLRELEKTIERFAEESKYGLAVRDAIGKCKDGDFEGGWELIKSLGLHSLIYLKRYIDFSLEEEKIYALSLLKRVFSEIDFPVDSLLEIIHNPLKEAKEEIHLLESVLHSLRFLLRHPSLKVKEKVLEVISILSPSLQKAGFDMDLSTIKILVNGLGIVGGRIVSVLKEMGFSVYVHDVDNEKVEQIVQQHKVKEVTKEDIVKGEVKFDLIVDAASVGQGRINKSIYTNLNYTVPILYQGGEEFTIAQPFVFDITPDNLNNIREYSEFRVENCNMMVSYLLLSCILKELGEVDIENYYEKSLDFGNVGAKYSPYPSHNLKTLIDRVNPGLGKYLHTFQSYRKSGSIYGYHLHKAVIRFTDERKRVEEIEQVKRLLAENENGFRILVIDEKESEGWGFEEIIKDIPEEFKDTPIIPVRIRMIKEGTGIILEYAVPHGGIAVPDNILLIFLKLGLDLNLQSLTLNKYLIEIEKKKELLRTYINFLLSFQPYLDKKADDTSYKVIKDGSVRDFLLHSARRIVEESRRLGIKTIFLNGESARPAGELVKKYWQTYYPWDVPNIYYLKGVQQVSSSPRIETSEPGVYNESEVMSSVSSIEDLDRVFSSPILILEEGTVYGNTLEKSREVLKGMRAREVYTGTLIYNPRFGEESIKPDIVPVGELTPKQWMDLSWNWYLRKHGTKYYVEHGEKPSYYVYHLPENERYFDKTMAELEQFFESLYKDFEKMVDETCEGKNSLISTLLGKDFYELILLYLNLDKLILHKEKEVEDSIKRAVEDMVRCSGAKPGIHPQDEVQRLIRNWLGQRGNRLEWDYEFLMKYYLAIDSLFDLLLAKIGIGAGLRYLKADEIEKIKNILRQGRSEAALKRYMENLKKNSNYTDNEILLNRLEEVYKREGPGCDDYYVKPIVLKCKEGRPIGVIKKGEIVIWINHRGDRSQAALEVFTNPRFNEHGNRFDPEDLGITFIPFANYDSKTFEERGIKEVFPFRLPDYVTLSQVLRSAGVIEGRFAESDKGQHITYFFDGRRNINYDQAGIHVEISPSENIPDKDKKPEMKFNEVAEAAIRFMDGIKDRREKKFLFVNFALDIQGHNLGGDIERGKKAVLAADEAVGRLREKIKALGGVLIVTADHGNVEEMALLDENGIPLRDEYGVIFSKQHTVKNPVPFIVEGLEDVRFGKGGALPNIAPTVLEILGIQKPDGMADSLLEGYRYREIKGPVVVIIRDGWGMCRFNNPEADSWNAVKLANPPVDRDLMEKCPWTLLKAHGDAVGLPEYQMGDSDNGHTTIGAGRVIPTLYEDITNQIENGKFYENQILIGAFQKAMEENEDIHIIGLISDGGVHSDYRYVLALLEMAKRLNIDKAGVDIYIHAMLDGRDVQTRVPTQSGLYYLRRVLKEAREHGLNNVCIADVSGRYYGMDRDAINRDNKRKYKESEPLWKERFKVAYDAWVRGEEIENTGQKVGPVHMGLEKLSKKLSGIIAASVKVAGKMKEIERLLPASASEKFCIVVDKNRIPEGMGDEWGTEIVRLEKNGVFKVVDTIDEALKNYKMENIIYLIDPADLKETMPEGILYLPMPYLRSSLYMAAVVVSAGGDVSKIDPLVKGLIGDLYSKILGRDVTEEDLKKLFTAPWLILPEIKGILGEINNLRKVLVEIEKSA